MAKQTGIGCNYYVNGFDISGDTNALSKISGGPALFDTTDITQPAKSRLGTLRNGEITWVSFFNPSPGQEHAALSGLPTTDLIGTAFLNPLAIGSPAASIVGKLPTYDTKRNNEAEIVIDFGLTSNGSGLEWGLQLTPGRRTDVAATNGPSNDDGAATSFGAQAYLQVFSFVGTDITIKIQDSADNVTFADVATFAFATITSAPQALRDTIPNNAVLRRFVRVATTTAGGFTSCSFAVQYVRNQIAGVVF
jgi:hypothetical protein